MRTMRKPNREDCVIQKDHAIIDPDNRKPVLDNDNAEAASGKLALTNGRAAHIINRYTLAASAAGAVPFPGADVVAVSAIQADMIEEIAGAYGLRISKDWGRHIAIMLAGSMAVSYGVRSAFSALKVVPVIGSIVGGGASILSSAVTTYAIGKTVSEHLGKGGTLNDSVLPVLVSSAERIASNSRKAVGRILQSP